MAERSGDTAVARAGRERTIDSFRPHESGAEATALQALRVGRGDRLSRQRLDCGVFTAAFARATRPRTHKNLLRPKASGVALRFPPRSKTSRKLPVI